MYNNSGSNSNFSNQDDCYDPKEENNYHYLYSQEYQGGIKIPPPNNPSYSFKNEMGNRYKSVYDDILSFASDSDINMYSMSNHDQYAADDDPMEDQQFMAFLSSISTSEPVLNTSEPLLLQSHDPQPSNSLSLSSPSSSVSSSMKTPLKKKRVIPSKGAKKPASAKLGQCEHPKHILYRQEKYKLLPSSCPEETSMMKTVPRRGRPPKGSKTSEFLFSTSPIISKDIDSFQLPHYPIVELTVRPLPRRLEAVVGRSNIKVCLTCLKRSDTDPDYLKDQHYIGPQHILKRKNVE